MADEKKEKVNIHRNHRQKVREKYYASGFKGMAPHNILEMLLFFGIPYKDTNPIAHELIDRFGSLSAVFEASRTDLMQIKGMTENAACLITMILPLYQRYSHELVKRRPVFSDEKEIADFLRTLYLDNNSIERVFLLCFDGNNSLITCRMVGEGDVSSSNFDMRKLASAVLETNAASVVLSHNHPHGIAVPSFQDKTATQAVAALLNALNVRFVDHIIVTDKDHFSMAKSIKYVELFYNLEAKKRFDD